MSKKRALFLAISVVLVIAAVLIVVPLANDASDGPVWYEGEGMNFDGLSLYSTAKDNLVTEVPVTYEAYVMFPSGYSDAEAGTIFGNYRSADLGGVRFRIRENGRPHLYYTGEENALSVNFYDVSVSTGSWVHLTIVDDVEMGEMRCYVDGALVETVEMTDAQKAYNRDVSGMPMCIGGDFIAGTNNFKGQLRSVAVYSDVRSEEEIFGDMFDIDLSDEDLIAAYNLNGMQNAPVIADLTGKYDMINNRMTSDWAEPEALPELEEYAYSMALIGDTQIVSAYYPEQFHNIIDWLLANQEAHKIAHVLNMGDMTNFNLDEEWDLVRDQYFRLNGKLDYTLVRGDHDVLDDGVADNGDDTAKYDRWFNVPAYTDRFTNSEDADYYKGENGSITNSYRTIEIKGNKYLIVTVDKYPSEEVLTWVDAAIKKYPQHRVIMTMHCFITDKGEYIAANKDPNKIIGEDLWERIKGYSNLEMVICGHEYAYGVVWTKAEGTNGNVVNQILANPQGPDFDREGATGMIAMLYFSEDGKDVQVRYYSPIINKYFVGNNNDVTSDTYRLESSVFKMTTDDMTPAEQTTEFKTVTKVNAFGGVYAESLQNDNKANIDVYAYTNSRFTKGSVNVVYDSTLLSNPVVSGDYENLSVKEYDGSVIITFDGYECEEPDEFGEINSKLFSIEFDSAVESGVQTNVEFYDFRLGYTEGENEYVFSNLENGGVGVAVGDCTVVYGEGDDFKAKMEEALYYAKYGNVNFVMKSGFKATESITIGDVNTIYKGFVYVYSEDTENPVEIDTAGFNIIFNGNYQFDYVTISGNGTGASNSLFFPNGSAATFANNITTGENTANVTGANITIFSGEYYFVGALIDDTIGMSVSNPYIILGGTAVADCLSGGSRLSGNVYGWSIVNLMDSASVTRYASASGYASSGCHDGQLDVDTTGTVGRLCAAIGPVGSESYSPTYYLTVKNVNCTTDVGIMGVRSIVKNKTSYVNAIIEVYDGKFTKESYFGLYAASNYTGSKLEGNVQVYVYGGEFEAEVYGGGYMAAEGAENSARVGLEIYGGSFAKTIYGGSKLESEKSIHSGDIYIGLNEGCELTQGLYGGSNIINASASHTGVSEVIVDGAKCENILFAGSQVNVVGGKNEGSSSLVVYRGSFENRIFAGAALSKANTTNTGDSVLEIFGGNTFSADVIGGVRFDKAGTGYALNDGDGSISTGEVCINIYDFDYEGNPATATFNGNFYGSFFGITAAEYAEVIGDTTYDIRGAVFNGVASAGPRLQAPYQKHSGNITGTVVNVTAKSGFFGGATINNKTAVMTGDTSMTLGDGVTEVEVTGIFAGGNCVNAVNAKVDGDSEIILSSGVTLKSGAVAIGGNYAGTSVFSSKGAATEWGFYGSSNLVVDGATVESGAKIVGGAYVVGTPADTSLVDWSKYPVNGGKAGASETTKITVESGTVSGPYIYAGSYLAAGGQDHGNVELEINGGKVILTTDGIKNYGTSVVKALYPATYYPTNKKNLNCNFKLSLNDGEFEFPRSGTNTYSTIGICGGISTYVGNVTGDTCLNLAVDTAAGKDFNYRPANIMGGNHGFAGVLTGDTTLNVTGNGTLNSSGIITAGCGSSAADLTDVAGDGIKFGFKQIGDVTFNFSGKTISRLTYASGYRSNVDGNVYINITSGNINQNIYGTAGLATAVGYSSVTGDVIWNISGGVFHKSYGVYGGGLASSSYNPANEYNVIGGNIYMEISGGTFNGILSLGGLNGVNTNKKASVKFVGDGFSFGSGAKVMGYGNGTEEYSIAGDANYILDLVHTSKEVTASEFGSFLEDMADGATVTLSNTTVKNGTVLAEFMKGQTMTINGKVCKYDDVTYFNDYTEYDNEGFDFYTNSFGYEQKIETIDVINKVIVGVGEDRSAEITLNNTSRDTGIHGHVLGTSLTLSDSIAVNMGVKDTLFTAYSNIRVKAIFNGEAKEYDAPTRDALYSYENIGPHMMNDAVYFMIYATNADGEEVSSGILNQTIKKFCTNKLATSEEVFKKVCMDLLNYGAAAQVYANYQTDTPANTGVDAYKQYATAEMAAVSNKSKIEKIENATVALQAPNLYLDKNVEIRYTYKPTEEKLEELVAKVVLGNGTEFTLDIVNNADNFIVYEEGGFVLRINQLNPSQMRETVTVSFWKGETQVSHAVTYSIESYVASKLSQTSALKDMIVEMMKYGDAVKAWQDAANA